MCRIGSFVLLVAVIASCGRDTTSTFKHLSSNEQVRLLVASGGWNSCGSGNNPLGADIYKKAIEITNNWPHPTKPRFIVSCFSPDRYVFYKKSFDPRIYMEHSISGFVNYIRDEARRTGGKQVFIGHSHGGWLLMKTTRVLHDRLNLFSLNTIDAISYKKCIPEQFFNNDCQRAPSDFSSDDKKIIAASAGAWRNDYQRQSYVLRSSAIAEAHFNKQHRQSSYSHYSYAAHTNMDGKWEIWEDLRQRIQAHSP